MKIAVLGLGRRIAVVLRHLREAFQEKGYSLDLAGYYDVVERGHIPGCPRFDSIVSLLDGVNPDVVFVGSPNHRHLEHILAALQRGCRVFTEKPAVIGPEQSRALLDAVADRPPDTVLIGFPLRSAPIFRQAQEWLAEGRIGTIISIEANEHLAPWHGAFIAQDWRRKAEYGGSYLLDKAVHDFDLFQAIAGSWPETVASFGGKRIFIPENRERLLALHEKTGLYDAPGTGADRLAADWEGAPDSFSGDSDITDHQAVMVRYRNGILLSFHSNTHAAEPQRAIQVIGTEGIMRVDFVKNHAVFLPVGGGKPEIFQRPLSTGDHYGADPAMVRDLRDALVEGKPFPGSVTEGICAGLTVMAADRSLASGTVVCFSDFWPE